MPNSAPAPAVHFVFLALGGFTLLTASLPACATIPIAGAAVGFGGPDVMLLGDGDYEYSYTATVTALSAGLSGVLPIVTDVSFSGIQGLVGNATATGSFGFTPTVGVDSLDFRSAAGFTATGQMETFAFEDDLPPTGAVTTAIQGAVGGAPLFPSPFSQPAPGPGLTSSPGGSQGTALTPTSTADSQGGVTYAFASVLSGDWVDPPASDTLFSIEAGEPLFADIILPTDINPPAQPYTIEFDGMMVQADGGGVVDFGAGGVSTFSVLGVDDTNSADTGLPVQVFFRGGGPGSFTEQSLGTVPEPSPLPLLSLGLLPVGTAVWRRVSRRRISPRI